MKITVNTHELHDLIDSEVVPNVVKATVEKLATNLEAGMAAKGALRASISYHRPDDVLYSNPRLWDGKPVPLEKSRWR